MKIDTKKFSFYTAILVSIFALITFIVASTTIPITGPFCRSNCISYPYNNVLSQFPKDYYWMFLTIVFMTVYLILFICLEYLAKEEKKLFAKIATIFAAMSAATIILCYFVHISVIQPSLINGETAGISLISQYNPHGVFIALEEIGYLLMSVSFIFAALTLSNKSKLEKIIRWVFTAGFILTITAFILIASSLGLHREYIFEVAAITITWFTLIINGALIAIFLR